MSLHVAVELLWHSRLSSNSNYGLANIYEETTICCMANSNAPPVLKHLLVYGSVNAGQLAGYNFPVIIVVWFCPEVEL